MFTSSALTPVQFDDAELDRLIRTERVRMLFAPTLPASMISAIFSVALAAVVGPKTGWPLALIWAFVCCLMSVARLVHLRAYVRAHDRDGRRWLRSLVVMAILHGGAWGMAGVLLMPVHDLVTVAVVVATLVGASAVCTFTLQAHMAPNLAINLPMLVPAALMLFTRHDSHGFFGGAGLLTLLGVMLFESRRSEQRITELLWLRFTTDRIAQERAEALKLAQRHSAVKDQFLATMSHEMRTPLHGILGLARLVHNKLPARPGVMAESRHHLELVERAGEHLLEIINDVLDFSRIEAGKLHIVQASFDLSTLIHDVLGLLSVTASDKGLRLVQHVSLGSPCWVEGDAARVRQVLHNLVGNAIKFTDTGEVHVTVERHRCEDDDGPCARRVVFIVKDTGMGIPLSQQAMIFDAFHQADGSFGRRHRGTGLGLTISRELARAMGGDILCVSQPGEGSTFTLTVPLPAAESVRVDLPLPLGEASAPFLPPTLDDDLAEMTPLPPAKRPRSHVLLAEDNPVNALVAEASLTNLGIQVTRVDNGQEALDQLQHPENQFDLVLMDCQMPDLDGIEATRRLRVWETETGRAPITVVALTANVMTSDRARCLAAGMNDHLAKPFRQDELLAMLKRHLPSVKMPQPDDTPA